MKRLFPTLLCLCVLTPSWAAQPKNGVQKTGPDPVAQAVLADQLVAYGDQQNEPMAYLLAARMLKDLRARDAVSGSTDLDTVRALLARAQQVAANNPEILALAARQEAALKLRARGPVSGLTFHRDALAAGKSREFVLNFQADEETTVGLTLDAANLSASNRGQTDLDLIVRDEAQRTICAQEGPGVPELCAWTPRQTGKFSIQVVNRGAVPAAFQLHFR